MYQGGDTDPAHAGMVFPTLPPHAGIRFATPRHGAAVSPPDCQLDCQPLERALFSLDGGGLVQAADLVIWTAMDRPEQAGKS
jgi:hypothetical protein